jgi:CDK inhibitor PHO81
VHAITEGRTDCARLLIESGSCVDANASNTLSPLCLASFHGQGEIVILLMKRGAKNLANSDGFFPIHLACREGHADVVELLLVNHGSDEDILHEGQSWTPLFYASSYGYPDVSFYSNNRL